MSGTGARPPASGLAAMRIAVEFGGLDAFAELMDRTLARAGEQGATLVALLDRGDLGIHMPRIDGPCWNSVPLFHLRRGEDLSEQDWTTTTGILEKLERYR